MKERDAEVLAELTALRDAAARAVEEVQAGQVRENYSGAAEHGMWFYVGPFQVFRCVPKEKRDAAGRPVYGYPVCPLFFVRE